MSKMKQIETSLHDEFTQILDRHNLDEIVGVATDTLASELVDHLQRSHSEVVVESDLGPVSLSAKANFKNNQIIITNNRN